MGITVDKDDLRDIEHRFTSLEIGQAQLNGTTARIEEKIDKFVDTADKRYLVAKDCGGVCRAPDPGTPGAMIGRVFTFLGFAGIGAVLVFIGTHWTSIMEMVAK